MSDKVPNCQTCGACCLAINFTNDHALRPFADMEIEEAVRIEKKHPVSSS